MGIGVPLAPTTGSHQTSHGLRRSPKALHRYLHERDRLCPRPAQTSLFISTVGTRLAGRQVRAVFAGLVERAGLEPRFGSGRATIHDLRHSSTVATLLDWYRNGSDVAASAHTIASYRDTMRLFLGFAHDHTGKMPLQLDFADLDATLIAAFLTHLERDRHNSVATRNARLSAIRSLFAYAALRHPEHAELIRRVLAMPAKRCDQTIVCYLTPSEIDAVDRSVPTPLPGSRPNTQQQQAHQSPTSTSRPTYYVLRHTAAMNLLQGGVDVSVIALWLGHENIQTTQIYLHADLALKERSLDRTAPANAIPGRYRPSDPLAFSRRVVGWSIGSTQTSTLVTNALGMAIQNR